MDNDGIPCSGYKIVRLDYTPPFGERTANVYRVGTRHRLGQAAVLDTLGFHYCTEALRCLDYVPRVMDFGNAYRLLRVIDESLPGTRAVARDRSRASASHLYVESEVTDPAELRRLLTGATPKVGLVIRHYVDGAHGGETVVEIDDSWHRWTSGTDAIRVRSKRVPL